MSQWKDYFEHTNLFALPLEPGNEVVSEYFKRNSWLANGSFVPDSFLTS